MPRAIAQLAEWNVDNAAITVLIGVVCLGAIFGGMAFFHPVTQDGRVYAYTTPLVPQVKGRVTEVLAEPNVKVSAGDPLFRLDTTPFVAEERRLALPPHKPAPGLRLACQVQVEGDLTVTKRPGFFGHRTEGRDGRGRG